jgi:histone H4
MERVDGGDLIRQACADGTLERKSTKGDGDCLLHSLSGAATTNRALEDGLGLTGLVGRARVASLRAQLSGLYRSFAADPLPDWIARIRNTIVINESGGEFNYGTRYELTDPPTADLVEMEALFRQIRRECKTAVQGRGLNRRAARVAINAVMAAHAGPLATVWENVAADKAVRGTWLSGLDLRMFAAMARHMGERVQLVVVTFVHMNTDYATAAYFDYVRYATDQVARWTEARSPEPRDWRALLNDPRTSILGHTGAVHYDYYTRGPVEGPIVPAAAPAEGAVAPAEGAVAPGQALAQQAQQGQRGRVQPAREAQPAAQDAQATRVRNNMEPLQLSSQSSQSSTSSTSDQSDQSSTSGSASTQANNPAQIQQARAQPAQQARAQPAQQARAQQAQQARAQQARAQQNQPAQPAQPAQQGQAQQGQPAQPAQQGQAAPMVAAVVARPLPAGRERVPIGSGGFARHRKVLRDNIGGITKPAIRRLARRGGVVRISNLMYEEVRSVLKVQMENVIRDAVTYTEHARRKTVTALDCGHALIRQGQKMYGYGC